MATSDELFSRKPPTPVHALRLTFEYRNTDIRLIESRRVTMITPPVVTPVPKHGQIGYWFQVTEASGRIVYHRPLHSPIAIDIEVYAQDREQSIARVPVAGRGGQFTVLVPDLPDATSFALHGPIDPEKPSESAQELLRLDIDAIRKSLTQPHAGQSGPGTTERN